MKSINRHMMLSKAIGFLTTVIGLATVLSTAVANGAWRELNGRDVRIAIAEDLSLTVLDDSGKAIWRTHQAAKPSIVVTKINGQKGADGIGVLELGAAMRRHVEAFDDSQHRGHTIILSGFPNTDVRVELVLALDSSDELLAEVRQAGGADAVQAVRALYNWSLAPDAGSYAIVPLGSGYLIRADLPNDVDVNGFVGATYSLPLFGMRRGDHLCYQIVESWWDAKVQVTNASGKGIDLSLDWEPSLGTLTYPRRVLVRFAKGRDHVGMAKAYRRYLIERSQFSTLNERMEKQPALKKFLSGVEYRWTHRDPARPDEEELVLDNIRRFQAAGIPVTFFYPKWPSAGHSPLESNSAWWQAALLDEPSPGGWPALVKFANEVRKLGCPIQVMVTPHPYVSGAPEYDAGKATGLPFPNLSMRYATWANSLFLDRLRHRAMECDALYYDGYSAHLGFPEHRDAQGPLSRREAFEAQVACFRQTRSRGLVPGAELARFWAIGECDFFFFTDWSADRMRHGEPVPLAPLVFHDCYAAHFSGGGYYNEGKYDWYADRHPRLYELMYAAMPSHNWLPGGSRPIERNDWDTGAMKRRLEWLRLWHAYYQKVCCAEMLSHAFLSSDHTMQRVQFAGDVTADFDLARGRFRVRGVPGVSADWQAPPNIPNTYDD